MIQWVVEAAIKSQVGDVIVATPDAKILDVCEVIGVKSVLTRADHPSGTDRIAEVSQTFDADLYVNVQGDEPLLDPADIHACANPLQEDPSISMGSLFAICPNEEEHNPAVVKVVTDLDSFALYFSRHPIPYPRNARETPLKKHLGLYAYRKEVLQSFSTWNMTPLETTESLEQLRFLEHGVRIKMSQGKGSALAVDTPEQAEQVRRILKNEL